MMTSPRVFTLAALVVAGALLAPARQHADENGDDASKADLAKLQGAWELTLEIGNRTIRSVKKVEGNELTVTRFDENGTVVSTHTSEFTLVITDRVKIFTYSNIDKTTGQKKRPRSYIYTVDDDTWVEARGLLRDQAKEPPRVFVWKRVRANVAANNRSQHLYIGADPRA